MEVGEAAVCRVESNAKEKEAHVLVEAHADLHVNGEHLSEVIRLKLSRRRCSGDERKKDDARDTKQTSKSLIRHARNSRLPPRTITVMSLALTRAPVARALGCQRHPRVMYRSGAEGEESRSENDEKSDRRHEAWCVQRNLHR